MMRKLQPFKVPNFRKLLEISANRKIYNSQTPLQKWCYLYGIGKSSLKPIGIPIFKEDQTLHWNSYIIITYIVLYCILGTYTAIYYTAQRQAEKWLPCTVLFILAISVIPILVLVLSDTRYEFRDLIAFGGKYIYVDSHDDTEYNRIVAKNIDATVRSFFIKMTIMFLSYSTVIAGPSYAFFVQGIKTTTTQLKFPFIDADSNTEFIMNIFCQSFIGTTGMLGYVGLEVAMGLFDDFANISPKLVEYELRKFDEKLTKNNFSKSRMKYIFTNIMRQALQADDYIGKVRDLLYYRTLITPPTFNLAIAMAIFCQYSMNFAAGYGLAVISYVQVYYICELGDSIENNGFDMILYESKWYNLPVKYQKDMMHMINRKQNGTKITVGPFGVINRELTTVTTNKIYSLVMFLKKFTS